MPKTKRICGEDHGDGGALCKLQYAHLCAHPAHDIARCDCECHTMTGFGTVLETTDAPALETTAIIPKKRTDQPYDDGPVQPGADAPD